MDRLTEDNSLQNDTFNARHKSSVEVASDFIPPPQFNELLKFNNCLVIGPRGSGKTTLLKMLQAPALASWYAQGVPDKVGVSDLVNFVGVFVAADVRWAKQLELVTSGIDDEKKRTVVHESAFSNFVNLSFIDAIQKSIQLGVLKPFGCKQDRLDAKVEYSVARSLSDIWRTKSTPTFSALKHALRVQQSEIPKISNELISRDFSSVCNEFPFLGLSWLDSLTFGIETVNEIFELEGQKWALLVDELEIIPIDLLRKILTPLRSTSSNLVFKYALSPTGAWSDLLMSNEDSGPMQGNDFATLTLWNSKKEDARGFSTGLLSQALRSRGLLDAEAELPNILGLSWAVEAGTTEGGHLDDGRISIEQRKKLFVELASKDESFRSYIINKGIDIDSLPTSDKSENGTLVRKITPLVYLRNHVLRAWSVDSFSYRSKISYQPYFNYPNILDLTEGNPRWILNLAENLAVSSRIKGKGVGSQGVQADAINSFKDRFVSMLRVYPVGRGEVEGVLTPYDFLQELSKYIREKIYKKEFSSDPALAFSIDKESVDRFGRLILICIHLGALVLIDDSASKESSFIPGTAELEGRVVRLCYRLAPEFFLPLRMGRVVKMHSALSNVSLLYETGQKKLSEVRRRSTDGEGQINLF